MGIPSYYKKLIDTIPGLVSKGNSDKNINWLFMDFNCLIYHCLHREDTPIYPGDYKKDEWEDQFIDCIKTYCLKVIKEVNPKNGVFIAIDGVVPMAKMRQQRLRRFKSIWLSENTNENNENQNKETWDKNAITPGTIFMKKLRIGLENMILKHGKKSKWSLSSSDEPGEGEHKIISEWRKGTYNGNFAVYGLDADLIVLSILGRETNNLNNNIWLFREEVNAGKIAYDDNGEEIFEWFSINLLQEWLTSEFSEENKKAFIINYCFAMSVLGNDFLPTSLSLKIRDDGHSELVDNIRSLINKEIYPVNHVTLELSYNAILELFRILSINENNRIQKYIHRKQMMAKNLCLDTNNIKIGDNNWPLYTFEESNLIDGKQLLSNWKNKYMTHFFNDLEYNTKNINKICKEYLSGIKWIWEYYTGKMENVCYNWYYLYSLPPLWSWISEYLSMEPALPDFPSVLVKAFDISPVEQLSIVLPLESWHLIPPCNEKRLPQLAPQYFPSKFSFESVGKRFFWECESMIPLPSILELKEIMKL